MPTRKLCEFKTLTASADPRFGHLYAIYSKAIPARERKSQAELSAMVTRADYCFLLAQEGSAAIGFSIAFVPVDEPFCLLEYMAIHEGCRNRGLGKQLFEATARTVQKEYILLEVDSDHEPSTDTEIRKRRLSFYQRLGCRRIKRCSYILPLPGKGPPPKMDLLVHTAVTTHTIPKVTLRKWLEAIYSSVYRCPRNDSRIARMLDGVRDPVELG